jgi:hypothetical protein
MEIISDDYADAKRRQEYVDAKRRRPEGDIPETGLVQAQFVWTGYLTRWPCTVCGGCTEKVAVLTEGPGNIRACEGCLKCGDIDGHLERRAAQLENEARLTRSLIGRLKVPSYEEWQHEEERCDAWYENCSVEELRERRMKEKAEREAQLTEQLAKDQARIAAGLPAHDPDYIPF